MRVVFARIAAMMTLALVLGLVACAGGGDDDDASSGADSDDDANDDDADDDTTDDDTTDDDLDDDVDDDADDDTVYAETFLVVDIEPDTAPETQLAVHACAGLYNHELGGSVYTHTTDKDARWLEELDLEPEETVDAAGFLEACVEDFPRCVRYSYADQQRLLPNILTVGAVLGAVPLDEDMPVPCAEAAFDAVAEFSDLNTSDLATKYVYDRFVDETTGLAMLNPGYDTQDPIVWDPALTRDMEPLLVDYVYSEKLFTVFLVNGCIESDPEGVVLSEIIASNPWSKPIGVFGYADYWLVFGGYLFEAQTRCVDSRNMGAIPTRTTNLSFFSSRRPPIEEPGVLTQNELEDIEYDPDKTYVAFVIGDGDNIAYMMDARGEWLRQRLADCEQPVNSCAPMTWSISPHLPRLAPDVLEWYYEQSRLTGADYFMLPPSGHLYAYPASLTEDMQAAFVAATEADARILDTEGTVHWEWWHTWEEAETQFLPRYAGGEIAGVFPVDVPYMLPTFTGWQEDQFFNVLPGEDGGEVVLFRPREWRGIDDSGSGLTEPFYVSPENMAAELEGYPPGTVSYVYMTSDGGLNLENSFMTLVGLLPERVRLVSGGTAARLALDASVRRADR
ncbi:MAG: hypothetical protein IT350_19765 [Deltaproteobacteria bacterium]|nr:hypothetical protein [Deltaproteobacteria bacterium]